MATVYGTNATKRDVNVPADKIGKGEVNGKILFAYDEYVAAGVIANSTVIRLMKLPAGARLIDAMVSADDLGTTGTGTLGWEANTVDAASSAGIIAALDFNAAAANTGMLKTAVPTTGCFKKFSEVGGETQISITMTAATTAAGTIRCGVWYVLA